MPLILPGNVASATASTTYDVDNSCRFNSGDDPSLSRTSGVSPSSTTQGTLSFWLKRSKLGITDRFITTNGLADPYFQMYFDSHSSRLDQIRLQCYTGGSALELLTNQKFRDTSAWYNIILSYDSTPSTPSSSSIKLFVNGTQVTSFATETYPSQNQDHYFNQGVMRISSYDGSNDNSDAYMSEIVYCDGQSLDADSFGEFDSDSPTIWKPKDVSGLTFGTNGFYLDFEDSSALGNDVSGNDNDFTSSNLAAADQSTDTPTNNFCTLNPVATSSGLGESLTFSEGNCKIANTSDAAWEPAIGTMAVKAGKWYCEMKTTAAGAESYGVMDPVQYNEAMPTADDINSCSRSYTMYYSDGNATSDDESTAWGEDYGTGDIISIAVDLDNMKLYMAKNGTWVASGDPTSGATGTGTHVYFGGSKDNTRAAGTDYYIFVCAIHNNSTSEVNFGGCPGFAISSGNADANGYGNFEYAVPSGYLALCTKNLGSDGG